MTLDLAGGHGAPGLRQLGDPNTASGGSGDGSWGSNVVNYAAGLVSLASGTYGYDWFTFSRKLTTDFGEYWTTVQSAGGAVVHDLTKRGGVLSITAAGATFLQNSIAWNGPPVVLADGTDRFALIYRYQLGALPTNNAATRLWIGLTDNLTTFANAIMFGIDGSTSNTLMTLGVSPGLNPRIATTATAAALNAASAEIILACQPSGVATQTAVTAYVNRVPVGTQLSSGGINNLKPMFFNNSNGTLLADDFAIVYGQGL